MYSPVYIHDMKYIKYKQTQFQYIINMTKSSHKTIAIVMKANKLLK